MTLCPSHIGSANKLQPNSGFAAVLIFQFLIFYFCTVSCHLILSGRLGNSLRLIFFLGFFEGFLGRSRDFIGFCFLPSLRTRGKKLVPSHESEALEDKQKLQMKTFSELAECLARIPPKITLYGLLFKYNYVGCLLLLMFSSDLLFAIKRDAYISKETG